MLAFYFVLAVRENSKNFLGLLGVVNIRLVHAFCFLIYDNYIFSCVVLKVLPVKVVPFFKLNL